jgi:hypothetical protein
MLVEQISVSWCSPTMRRLMISAAQRIFQEQQQHGRLNVMCQKIA